MFFSKKSLLVLLLMVFSSASFANIFVPTDGNLNILGETGPTGSQKLAIFDDDSDLSGSAALEFMLNDFYPGAGMGAATINFSMQNGASQDWDVTSNQAVSGSGVLSDSSAFQLALWDNGNWLLPTSYDSVSPDNDIWDLTFINGNNEEVFALVVDASSVTTVAGASPVPLPGAVWLMTFAFGSLFAFGRRNMKS